MPKLAYRRFPFAHSIFRDKAKSGMEKRIGLTNPLYALPPYDNVYYQTKYTPLVCATCTTSAWERLNCFSFWEPKNPKLKYLTLHMSVSRFEPARLLRWESAQRRPLPINNPFYEILHLLPKIPRSRRSSNSLTRVPTKRNQSPFGQ